jgi:hypothetical protein
MEEEPHRLEEELLRGRKNGTEIRPKYNAVFCGLLSFLD